MNVTKPMLASAIKDVNDLQFPLIATPKIDGLRCLVMDGKPVSRTLKEIRNNHIRETLADLLPKGVVFDGELHSGDNFQASTSAVMRTSGEPEFTYSVFDMVTDTERPYEHRLHDLAWAIDSRRDPRIQMVPWEWVRNVEELLVFEGRCLAQGYEGVMTRTPISPYKCGRSTLKQGWLLKLKRFADGEAEVLSVGEGMHNTNEVTKNALGQTQRSTAKEGKVPAGWLGNFNVRDMVTGAEFSVGNGPGMTLQMRKDLWTAREDLPGLVLKYRYQPIGTKDAPRFPQFLGFRDRDDM